MRAENLTTFTLFVDIHLGKVLTFYSVYLTNMENLPFFAPFLSGKSLQFSGKYSPLHPSLNGKNLLAKNDLHFVKWILHDTGSRTFAR